MKLRIVGCSPAWPNPGGVQSGYLVEGDGRLLLDCGPGVLAALRGREPWPSVDAIALTHFHLDHFGDLVAWAFGAQFGPGREALAPTLWLPPGGVETLRALDRTLGAGAILEVFSPREYAEGVPFATAGFDVTPVRTAHYEELSFGFRVVGAGATLAYSGDAGPTAGLAELARDADLFLCEATLDEPEGGSRGHLTAEEAVDAHRRSGARRLLVVHRPDELPLPDGVERARDGLELEL